MKRPAESRTALKLTWLAARATAPISTRLSGYATARLWFTPWQVDAGERAQRRQNEWLEGTHRVTFDGDVPLEGFVAGKGPTVLLAHGWGERGASLGAFVRPLVEDGFRVVGVDLPGHGSAAGTQTDALKIAAALRSVAAAVGGVDAVIAHSMGGHATTLAISQGLDVKGVVLLAPSVRLQNAIEKFQGMFSLPEKAIEGLRATIERRYGPAVWTDLAGDRLAADLNVPALILHDREDPQVAPQDSELLAAAWPKATLEWTTGLGHMRIARAPEVVERVRAFLHEAVSPELRRSKADQEPISARS